MFRALLSVLTLLLVFYFGNRFLNLVEESGPQPPEISARQAEEIGDRILRKVDTLARETAGEPAGPPVETREPAPTRDSFAADDQPPERPHRDNATSPSVASGSRNAGTSYRLGKGTPGAYIRFPAGYYPTDPALYAKTPAMRRILRLVNRQRADSCRCGNDRMPAAKGPVRWNPKLAKAAYAHARWMKHVGVFSHTGYGYSSVDSRVLGVGYGFRVVGENIAAGYDNAAEVYEGWLNSPGHCRTMQNADVTEIGIARAGNHWVMVLGEPSEF